MIRVEVLRYDWTPGYKRLPGIVISMYEKLLCQVFVTYVKATITRNRKSLKWLPLSPSYLEYKRENKLSLNTWEATGGLKDSVCYRKTSYGYIITFKQNKYLSIARSLEYGNFSIPPRPLFRNALQFCRRYKS